MWSSSNWPILVLADRLEGQSAIADDFWGGAWRQNLWRFVEINPNTGKQGKRLVSEIGWRYDPRFDFSGLSYAQSHLLLRLRA